MKHGVKVILNLFPLFDERNFKEFVTFNPGKEMIRRIKKHLTQYLMKTMEENPQKPAEAGHLFTLPDKMRAFRGTTWAEILDGGKEQGKGYW